MTTKPRRQRMKNRAKTKSSPVEKVVQRDKLDKVKNWHSVREEILSVLKRKQKIGATASSAIQVYEELKHPHDLNCALYWRGHTTDVFVTYFPNSLLVWSIYLLATGQLEIKSHGIPMKKIAVLEYVSTYRVFVAFCPDDLTLFVFGDATNEFAEISSMKCPSTVLCLLYNRETEQLLAGTNKLLLRYSLTKLREGLIELEPIDLKLKIDSWIWMLKIDVRTQQLMVHCDNALFVLNYKTEKIVHTFYNHHSVSLTCTAVYPEGQYFFTAAKDGSIKIWNCEIFHYVHEFVGHHLEVTGMEVHKTEPLLISSSLDSTIRLWRLDTFQLHQRVDIGEPVKRMWMFNKDVAYQTGTDIKIAHINVYSSMFGIVQSPVSQLSRARCGTHKPKILVTTNDGSIRLVSPVTGMCLSIIYPFANCKMINRVLYRPETGTVYAHIDNNRVVVYNMRSNPAQPCYVLTPKEERDRVTSIVAMYLNDHFEKETDFNHTLIFAGYNDGSIDLIEAETFYLTKRVQAHQGELLSINASIGIRRSEDPDIGQFSRLVSAGTDGYICVFEIERETLDGRLSLTLLVKVKCNAVPGYVCMMGAALAYTEHQTGFLHVYNFTQEVTPENRIETIATKCCHESHDNHKEPVVGMDCCPSLGLFATVAKDDCLKVDLFEH